MRRLGLGKRAVPLCVPPPPAGVQSVCVAVALQFPVFIVPPPPRIEALNHKRMRLKPEAEATTDLGTDTTVAAPEQATTVQTTSSVLPQVSVLVKQ